MHIHGHFWQLVNGQGEDQPLKAYRSRASRRLCRPRHDGGARRLAFHCHLLYHMHAGMMRVVKVRPLDGGHGMKRLVLLIAAKCASRHRQRSRR